MHIAIRRLASHSKTDRQRRPARRAPHKSMAANVDGHAFCGN